MRIMLFCVFLLATASVSAGNRVQKSATKTNAEVQVPGSEACAPCHSEIYKRYLATAMARASGPALKDFVPGEFDDKVSGVRYRVFERDSRIWMSYERGSEFRGTREFLYFIGSGKKGRTYLFSDDRYLFEAPINWYSQENRWNMTPAYTQAREIPMNLPAFSSCLNCHTSGVQSHISGTANRYPDRPFLHNGITCERCHGSGEGHLNGVGSIVNPAKLPAERRDAICMECHFEGTVFVEQRGKHLYEFRPGEQLSAYVHYFVLKDNLSRPIEALSHFEALSLSACKRKSGERMWCGTCHDPHSEPAATEKATYYRSKCLQCHTESFAAKHHSNKPDCIACHMPSLPSKDVAHTLSTDHRILRYPAIPPLQDEPSQRRTSLEAFPMNAASLVTSRDLALAWETLAERGVAGADRDAEEFLRKALKETPDDPRLLSSYAFVNQKRGKPKEARDLYQRALQLRPNANTAATNLGLLEARSDDLQHAVRLWQQAFQQVPYQSAIGIDLALAFCTANQKDEARRYLERVLEFNPDYAVARQMLARLDGDPGECKAQR
jgi:Tetratricopeptide repeat/Cytochrome c554 and c-prime